MELSPQLARALREVGQPKARMLGDFRIKATSIVDDLEMDEDVLARERDFDVIGVAVTQRVAHRLADNL